MFHRIQRLTVLLLYMGILSVWCLVAIFNQVLVLLIHPHLFQNRASSSNLNRINLEDKSYSIDSEVHHGRNWDKKKSQELPITTMYDTDIIYSRDWWEKPVVIEEYKLIFFTIPKVACTEWKLLFHRMMGYPFKLPQRGEIYRIQDPKHNKLKTLDQYPLWQAQNMMNDPNYTKSIFVREPKERILSAFLNKFVQDKEYFRSKCCNIHVMPKKEHRDECNDKMNKKDFTYFLAKTQHCHDPHWEPQTRVIDSKWWPKISFVGYMNNLEKDAKRLLQSLISRWDNVTAWDKVGKDGWGDNGNSSFMHRNQARHAQSARSLLLKYYTPALEKFVEDKWNVDWNSNYFHFEKIALFGNQFDDSPNERRVR